VLAAGALTLAACAATRPSAPLTGPFVPASPAIARGERVFMAHCHACHPGGNAGLAPALNDKPLPGFLIGFQVRRGLGAMPAFGEDEIPPADLDALVAYLMARRAG
jgi:mono/diheme cytochrome c family protein